MTGLTPGQEKTAIAYAKARAIANAGSPPSDSALADAVASACEAAPPSALHRENLTSVSLDGVLKGSELASSLKGTHAHAESR